MNLSPLSVTSNFMVAQPPIDEHEQRISPELQGAPSGSAEALQERVKALEQELELVRMKGKLLSQEVDLFRQRRIVYWSDRFRNTFDAWNLMNPGFQQLKDDAAIFNGRRIARTLYGRGVASLRMGRPREGRADIEAAEQLQAEIGATFAGYGVTPP